jgi:hypothetical protein
MGTGHRDLLVVCGHWADLFSWTTKTEICLKFVGTGHRASRFVFRFYRFMNNKNRTEPNRTEPKPVGLNQFRFSFDFKILKLIMSVWLIFLCKNRIEPKMITPNYHESKTLHHTHMSHVVHLLINLGNV